MEIRVLRYFLTICQEGNISRAAQVLHVTQPTLSRQISELEHELGCTLFERGPRNVVLTEKGLYLRRRAEEIIALTDQTTSDLARDDSAIEGDINIGAGESEGIGVIARAIRRFQERYPLVRFHIRSGNGLDVTEWLDNGLVDFAALIAYPHINQYEHLHLEQADRWGVVMPASSPLAQQQTITAHDLEGLSLIVSKQAFTTGELPAWFKAKNVKPRVVATYNLAYNAAQLVKAEVGYALTLEGLVATGKDTGLEFKRIDPPLTSSIDFAWKSKYPLSQAAKLFLHEMQGINTQETTQEQSNH